MVEEGIYFLFLLLFNMYKKKKKNIWPNLAWYASIHTSAFNTFERQSFTQLNLQNETLESQKSTGYQW